MAIVPLPVSRMDENSAVSKTDDQLMAAYGREDRSAFDVLYNRYKDPLYGYLVRNCGDANLANEMFQDVWLRVISASYRYHQNGRFRAWLFTLAHNRLVDHYRKSAPTEESAREAAELESSERRPDQAADDDQQFARLTRVIGALPLEQRQAFYLREECGLAVKEIAGIQDITVEAAKSRLRYAYGKLREALRDEDDA